ncbi:TetR/AcrR family transcriptional regulator [Frankia sp. AiPs1]|uniref:TetR/AcrR family transcriptional regulator n=1 Tax=Frankia sp. AiPs1 TaxID=573493 RepID=UPI00204428C4|nr:TetR/AcrR family transcriptional regulator [Frankia sp. AiPs1]MCM3921983.1 TetR/AcrR family transcriptional regulator [Frankia sp. AiPs1]
MAGDTRQRMTEAAALSLRRRGLAATSFTDVLAASGAARGAIYHHFPGGKDDLAEQAVAWTGRRVRAEFASIGGDDPDAVLRSFIALISPVVAKAAGGTSCAVAAVTVEASPAQSALNAAADTAFRSWIDVLAARLRHVGVPPSQASATAQVMVAFLEGSLVLARAAGTVALFEQSASVLLRALTGSLD